MTAHAIHEPFAPPASPPPAHQPPAAPIDRLEDLSQIILAYNQVTENLQRSHEALRAQVARLQDQLASADAQLQRSRRLAALGEMAAGIAHEVRNPLAAIQLYAGMLIEDLAGLSQGVLPDPQASIVLGLDNARKISAAVRGLDGIVGDVLSFSREIRPRPRLVAVGDLFDRVVHAQQPAIDAAGVDVCRDAAGDDLPVRVDPDLLQQALVNLVRNAVEAMADASDRRLTLSARVDDACVMLGVRDTGPGVADEVIDRIFNPFFTTRHTGTGLGLAIVHRIIDAHAGAITVRNEGGAVFEIRLPVASLAEPAMEPAAISGGRA